MKKHFGLYLTILLLIGALLLLSGHTHPRHYLVAADYCALCQILQCGFTNVVSVVLTPVLIATFLILRQMVLSLFF